MKPRNRNIIIALIAVAAFAGFVVVYANYKDGELIEETRKRVESEMRFEQLVKDYAVLRTERDNIKDSILSLNAILKYKETHPSIIVKKYENKADSISKLSPNEAYLLFTNNIARFQNNIDRYSLQRFKRGN